MTTPAPAAQSGTASQQALIDAALVLLQGMGLTPGDLAAISPDRPAVPTFAGYVPVVSAAVGDGTRRGIRHVLEPRGGPVGHPAAGRADAIGHPLADGLRQGQCRGPA
jgi:hypothetical protein